MARDLPLTGRGWFAARARRVRSARGHTLVGDWDGDGRDTLAVYRPADATFYFRDDLGNVLPIAFSVEGTDLVPLTGDWNGDGRDSLALYRRDDATLHLRDDLGVVQPPVQFGHAER